MSKLIATPQELVKLLNPKVSMQEVKSQLKSAARHQFTVEVAGDTYVLIQCYFHEGDAAIWLLFCNGRLYKVIDPFSFPEVMERYPFRGTTASRYKFWDVEDPGIMQRILRVISAPTMSHAQIVNEVQQKEVDFPSDNTIPLSVFTDQYARTAVERKKEYIALIDVLSFYDGCKVHLGSSSDGLEVVYGKPSGIFKTRLGNTVRIYSEKGDFHEVSWALKFHGMAIVSDTNNRVCAVYSDENAFFNEEWLTDPLHADPIVQPK